MAEALRVLYVQHQDDCPPGYVGERLAQRGASAEIVRAQDGSFPDPREFDLVVPLGSDDAAYDESLPHLTGEFQLLSTAVEADVPVFGICFGAQLLARVLGGRVSRMDRPEIGWLTVDTTAPELVEPGPWLVWHLDVIHDLPAGMEVARTPEGVQAFAYGPHAGTQFHPEATLESAQTWADRYADSLARIGVDGAALMAETVASQVESRQRAYDLTDRVLDRALTRRAR